jgi:N-acetylmuramic acid 6-phosphate etherase
LIEKRLLFEQIRLLTTEQRNPESMKIDDCSLEDILRIINKEDKKVASIVEVQIPFIKKAVDIVVNALKDGGRLIYIGAGSSGRLGVLDAVECPPTYGTEPKSIQGVIAGGEKAMFCAQEGVEDKEENGVRDIDKIKVVKKDVVCGIAASLRTPYVMGAVKRAKKLKAHTIYITTNPRSKLDLPEFAKLAKAIDVAICPDVGPEVIMGSTRMKSGTAQKLVLNMITTAAMIKMGKVYENMMIDLQQTNKKLTERSKYIIMTITGVSYKDAEEYITKAKGKIKIALVMIKAGVNYNEAVKRLKIYNGFVKAAIQGKRTFVE